MMSCMQISYNGKSGRFIIKSPPWMVDVVRQLPNRRWDSKHRVWTAPAIRANAQMMQSMPAFAQAEYTDAAREALGVAVRPATAKRDGSFPIWYKPRTEPWSHQREALNKLYGLSTFALWADMRTGKTKIIIDMMAAYFMENRIDSVVIVCPNSVKLNWKDEIELVHCPIDASVHVLEAGEDRRFDRWIAESSGFRWLITSVEGLGVGSSGSKVERFLLTSTRSAMLVDESHKIKNPKAKRSEEAVRLGRMAEMRGILTGTPLAKGPMDVFMQFEFLDTNIIGAGDYYSFRNRYAVMGGYENKQILGYQNLDELMELIAPFVYQVRAEDAGVKLPPKTYQVRRVRMNPEQRRIYQSILKNKTASTDAGSITVQTALEKAGRLQQVCGMLVAHENPNATKKSEKYEFHRIKGTNPKIEEILDLTEEFSGPMIIWCIYDGEIDMVCEALRAKYGDDQVVEIHGRVDVEDRRENVREKFNTGRSRFLVGNPSVGGTGLTMPAAEAVVYYSNSFNFLDRSQSEERPRHESRHEIPVAIIDIICEDTVDELVLESNREKKDMSDYVRSNIQRMAGILGL